MKFMQLLSQRPRTRNIMLTTQMAATMYVLSHQNAETRANDGTLPTPTLTNHVHLQIGGTTHHRATRHLNQ